MTEHYKQRVIQSEAKDLCTRLQRQRRKRMHRSFASLWMTMDVR